MMRLTTNPAKLYKQTAVLDDVDAFSRQPFGHVVIADT